MTGLISSARRIVPYVMDMLSTVKITSVVNFGCGVGGWLNQCQKINTNIGVLGLDFGDSDEAQLQISLKNYRKVDLSKKICLDKKFDLCISLEVAEHINTESADIFLDNSVEVQIIFFFLLQFPDRRDCSKTFERQK